MSRTPAVRQQASSLSTSLVAGIPYSSSLILATTLWLATGSPQTQRSEETGPRWHGKETGVLSLLNQRRGSSWAVLGSQTDLTLCWDLGI